MLRLTRSPIAWMVGGILVALPVLAQPAGEARQDIPLTDPVLLERLGFEPDATNVYATLQALEELLMTPEERAVVQQARLEEYRAAREEWPTGGTFGTVTPGYSPIEARAIFPRRSQTEHTINADRRVCVSGSPIFDAQFESLPHGAKLERVDVWYHDSSDEDLTIGLVRICREDNGATSIAILGSHFSSGTAGPGFGTIEPSDEDIDVQSCAYLVQVNLDGGVNECSELFDLGIAKVRAQWRRQVSPPPASPTFNDVGPNHPFFQHVEALAASGITSGCDAGSFCPNAPLTRGQMAVFLAKALGLHWGEISQ